MDATLLNKINLLNSDSINELRLFINTLLKKQEKQVSNKNDSSASTEEKKPHIVNPLADMEAIPVTPDIIIDRYSIYED